MTFRLLPPRVSARVAIALAAAFTFCDSGFAQDAATPKPAAPVTPAELTPEAPVEPAPPEPVAVSEIVTTAEESSTFLKSVSDVLAADGDLANSLPELTAKIDKMDMADAALLEGQPSLDALRDAEAEWLAMGKALRALNALLSVRATELDADLGRIDEMEATWKATLASATAGDTPPEIEDKVKGILEELKAVRENVILGRGKQIARQEKVSAARKRTTEGLDKIRKARETTVGELFLQLNPPLWKVDLSTDVLAGLKLEVPAALDAQWRSMLEYLVRHNGRLLVHGAVLGVLLLVFVSAARRVKGWARVDPSFEASAFIFDYPYASAIILSVFCGLALYPLPPPPLRFLLGAVAILAAVRILKHPLRPALRPALNILIVLFTLNRLCDLTARVPLIERFLFLTEMLGGILFLGWMLRFRLSRKDPAYESDAIFRLLRTASLALVILFSFAFIADVFGYLSLARIIGNGTLASALLAIIVRALVRIIDGIIIFALRSRPLRLLGMVKRLRTPIEGRCEALTRFLGTVAWALGTLQIFSILEPVFGFVKAILTAALHVKDVRISLWDFIMFGTAVYLSVLISRFIRFILKEEIYPRAHLPRGMPFAISTVIHYALLLVGFFIALGLAGIDLTRITVLVGALGVGIGFGLQNIVNNFVSGLILLFERPVNVGDMVDVNGQFGELRRIGLRASVLRTPEGSELIVPNGDLISNNVTNWTLTDQQRRLEIPVGVAYGTDPERVLALLLAVADEHKEILTTPTPQALFMAFGESSLDFVLRAWTNEYQRWPQIRSELCTAINRSLAQANIPIPFPQRDLHLITTPLVASILEEQASSSHDPSARDVRTSNPEDS